MSDYLWKLFVGVHGEDAVIGAEGSCVDEDWMDVALYFILLAVFVEKVLSYFVGLEINFWFTFYLVMIYSSSRLT